MKTIIQRLFATIAIVFLTLNVHGQSNQNRLNQAELIKQTIGLWQTDPNKDTILYTDSRPFGKGIVEVDWMEVNGKTVAEYYLIYGFKDDSNDTIFIYTLDKSNGFVTTTKTYFISPTKAFQETISNNNVLFPTQRMIGEYISPDLGSATPIDKDGKLGKPGYWYKNGKFGKPYYWYRVKNSTLNQ